MCSHLHSPHSFFFHPFRSERGCVWGSPHLRPVHSPSCIPLLATKKTAKGLKSLLTGMAQASADCHRYPYIASLRDREGNAACSGVLIHQRFILTAAQCVDKLPVDQAEIAVGACNINSGFAAEVWQMELVTRDNLVGSRFLHQGVWGRELHCVLECMYFIEYILLLGVGGTVSWARPAKVSVDRTLCATGRRIRTCI